jgi:hypothetical protein
MNAKWSYFIFISLIWAGISAFILWDWIDGIEEKIAWNNFVRAGGCIAMDQLGNCYNAQEYQILLEEEKKIEIDESLAEFRILSPEEQEKFNSHFK